LLISVIGWALSMSVNASPVNIAKAGDLIAQAAVPWWISAIQWLAPLGLLGTLVMLLIVFLASKYGA
jgi:hypothetical protein